MSQIRWARTAWEWTSTPRCATPHGNSYQVFGRLAEQLLANLRAVACQFYERNGLKVEGTVAWKSSTIPGLVYRLTATAH